MLRVRSMVRLGKTSVVAAATAALAFVGSPAASVAAPATTQQGTAMEVPGSDALGLAGDGGVYSVSCASAGNCSAIGAFVTAAPQSVPFVVAEVDGTWQQAEKVPGLDTLNLGASAQIKSLSCASVGNCSAGGFYKDKKGKKGKTQAFVVSEVDGTWHQAEEVPGTATLNRGGFAVIDSVSCASAGNCGAVGSYLAATGKTKPLVVSEVGGTWRNAGAVPGMVNLDPGGTGSLFSVSCPSVGDCGAIGSYRPTGGKAQPLVVGEVGGTWRNAEAVPGMASLDGGRAGSLSEVSCGSAGNCSAGGSFNLPHNHNQAWVVGQVDGVWGRAEAVPGIESLNKDGAAGILSVSCASAGNCSAGGFYLGNNGSEPLVVSEVDGVWRQALEAPGTGQLNKGGLAQILSVSCGSAGNCSAVGSYDDQIHPSQALVVSEMNGTWQRSEEAPGIAVLDNNGLGSLASVSCPPAGACSAGGSYLPVPGGKQQAMVVSTTP